MPKETDPDPAHPATIWLLCALGCLLLLGGIAMFFTRQSWDFDGGTMVLGGLVLLSVAERQYTRQTGAKPE